MNSRRKSPIAHQEDLSGRDQLTEAFLELAIRLVALGVLLYLALVLVRPFIMIALWGVVLAVALYPSFERMARHLGGHRRLAAVLMTILTLLIVIGPATWLALGLIDSLRFLSERLDLSELSIPAPPESVKRWPLIGDQVYGYWVLASTNLKAALAEIAPQLKPLGAGLVRVAADTGTGFFKFFVSIIVAGFLLSPAPALVDAVKMFSRRLVSTRGEEFVSLAGATIRTVSRGVVGISALQALLAGIGLVLAGVPAASLLTSAVLVLGIIQIGPSVILIPVVIWSWFTMDTMHAILFTAYMVPVNLLDNILRPIVMGRGLQTPLLVILVGVVGGTLAYGMIGLFLGPIVLAVIWDLLVAWIRDRKAA
jgi:predicted PurR-regulated permease PerM